MDTPRVDTAQPSSGCAWIPSEVRTAHQHLKESANTLFFQNSFPEMENLPTSDLWGLWHHLVQHLCSPDHNFYTQCFLPHFPEECSK